VTFGVNLDVIEESRGENSRERLRFCIVVVICVLVIKC